MVDWRANDRAYRNLKPRLRPQFFILNFTFRGNSFKNTFPHFSYTFVSNQDYDESISIQIDHKDKQYKTYYQSYIRNFCIVEDSKEKIVPFRKLQPYSKFLSSTKILLPVHGKQIGFKSTVLDNVRISYYKGREKNNYLSNLYLINTITNDFLTEELITTYNIDSYMNMNVQNRQPLLKTIEEMQEKITALQNK